jgi:hypothetical protein
MMELYDVTGKMIYSSVNNALNGNFEITIPTENLSNGIYLIRTSDGNNIISKKIKIFLNFKSYTRAIIT